MGARILAAVGDRLTLESVRRILAEHGFDVDTATSGEEALSKLGERGADLLLLDIGADRAGVSKRVRAEWRLPIIVLTERRDATDRANGMEVGADDYLAKPFEPSELLARVRAQLRRAAEGWHGDRSNERIEVGGLVIDFQSRCAHVRGKIIGLTSKEFELLAYLGRNAGRVLNRDTIFERVWGYGAEFGSNSLDVYLYRLRQKIEDHPSKPRYLHTVRGYGYRLQDETQ